MTFTRLLKTNQKMVDAVLREYAKILELDSLNPQSHGLHNELSESLGGSK